MTDIDKTRYFIGNPKAIARYLASEEANLLGVKPNEILEEYTNRHIQSALKHLNKALDILNDIKDAE